MKQQQLLELYDAYSDNVFRLALSFLGNTADAEDIVQNVHKTYRKKSTYKNWKREVISPHNDSQYVQEQSEIRS